MVTRQTRWRKPFMDFIAHMRIDSKEVAAVDEFGSPLNLWMSQKMILDQICDGLENGVRIFDILKARQLGATTLTLAMDMFWLAIHPGIVGALVSDTEDNRDVFRAILKRYIQNLPDDLVGDDFRLTMDNSAFMQFSKGQRLDFLVAGTKNKATWGESRGYTFAHMTEVANYGNPSGIASFMETLSETHPDRLLIRESTAKSFNHWKDMCDESQRDTYTKKFIFVGWWAKELNCIRKNDKRFLAYGVEPPNEREQELIEEVYLRHNVRVGMEQLAWYRWRSSDVSVADADKLQNLPWIAEQAFVFTGFSFFQTRLIVQDMNAQTDPENKELYQFEGYKYHLSTDFFDTRMELITEQARIEEVQLRVYEEPVREGQYAIGCDPAFGRNDWKDRTVVSVWRCYADRLVQVAEFGTADYEAHQCAWVLAHLAAAYRNCIVNLEISGGPGLAIMREWDNLKDKMRSHLFQERVRELQWDNVLQMARWYLYHKPDSMGAGYCYNFKTSRDLKFDLMNRMRTSYSTRQMWVRSKKMLEEMQAVVQDGPTIEAPGRGKDDRVIAGALANFAWDEWIKSPMLAQGLSYELVSAREAGELNPMQSHIDRMVRKYFVRAEEEANNPRSHIPQYMQDRGLA